ncbi:MAG: glycosyltransferase family 4 protein [Oleiphilaceae bacterium]|nr:glycosyltransferase family 4 protein [Oleiphilaceae bacterium]
MRILLVARHPVGGIRTFLRYIYSQPCFDDLTLTLIAPDEGLGSYLDTHLPAGRIRLIPVPHSGYALFRAVRSRLSSGDFDLVHSHGFSAGVITQLAMPFSKLPHLMTAHDVFLERQFAGWKGSLKQWVIAQTFRRIEAVHTVTEEARENFLHFFPSVETARVHGILHGVDTEYFASGQATDHRALYKLDASVPLIGFFGRFMAQKGFRDLVDAMALLVAENRAETLPRVITFGWGGFIREDYQYLAEKGLSDYFIQAPATDNMAGALKGVDLVAMPSHWEACGLLAMEALSAGVPVVGTDCVGLNEVLQGTPAVRVTLGHPDALAQALLALMQPRAPERFRQYQPRAIERFHIQRPARALRGLYDRLQAVPR